ncbi:DUF1853 family protein [Amphritea sp. HPY]|uniref:DUF1853 family protein n=1 Tax=Amphritea sp. HPY TaxID=3421652 RepID=UPI003D7D7DAB
MSTLPDSFADYRHEIVRDLAWLIHSPGLVNLPESLRADWLFDYPHLHDQLTYFDQHPNRLICKLRQQASYRLGYYFEDLVRIYLKNFIQPSELKSNIQVCKDKTTVGEYDFLIRLQSGEKIHLETAVKFYLFSGTDSSEGLAGFIGPNRTDCLERKWNRLMDHQLRLSQTSAGSDQAEALDLMPDRRSLLLKGYLFYPYAHWQDFPVIEPLNPDHARGWWLKVSQCDLLSSDKVRYRVLMKPQWLATARVKYHDSMSHAELVNVMSDLSTPLLIAELTKDTQSNVWRERSRGFLVPDNWQLAP